MIIWLFQTGEPLPSDDGAPRPMRAMNLANVLVQKGHRVVLWSSEFYHRTKTHRSKTFTRIKVAENLEVRLIPSSGYKTNISISRLYDHNVLAWNLRKQLKCPHEVPDVAFVGYPPIEAAYVLVKWLKRRDIPSILDVKDQWPKLWVDTFPHPLKAFARIFMSPHYMMAKRTMLDATGICAHTNSFLNWSLSFSNRKPSINDFVAPLTTPDDPISTKELSGAASWWTKQGVKQKKAGLRLMFVGSFSRAFDFGALFSAADQLRSQDVDCEFILCGDGERDSYLRSKAKSYDNIKIFEWIDRPRLLELARLSDVAIAPYRNTDNFITSIPNKIIDSLMLGLPILSPLQGEVAALIDKYKVGLSYGSNFLLSDCIKLLTTDDQAHKQMSSNAISLYKSHFDFNTIYNGLALHLENMTSL